MSQALDPQRARFMLERLAATGQPPEWGVLRYSTGLDRHLAVLDAEYLNGFVAAGGSAFKLVVGSYGGGKTHFLYCVRELAWSRRYLVAYVPLSPEETPFHDRLRVYATILRTVQAPPLTDELPSGHEQGIAAFLRREFQETSSRLEKAGTPADEISEEAARHLASASQGLELISFSRAAREAAWALVSEDDATFEERVMWFTAEGGGRRGAPSRGSLRPLDRGVAFAALRSFVRYIRTLGYRGLVLLFDEAEQVPSLSSKQRDRLLSNLRELVDECGNARFQGVLCFYAVPGEEAFQGRSGVYEALRQRLATIFEFDNPYGVKVLLDQVAEADPIRFLTDVGRKLAEIFRAAHGSDLDEGRAEAAAATIASAAYERRFADIGYRRLFVQSAIRAFQALRADPDLRPGADWATRIVRSIE